MGESNRSVLYDVQIEQGGSFVEYGPWSWASNFGDPAAEFEAIRKGVVLWDVYALQKWDVTGPDAVKAIQRVFSNNLSTLAVGQVRYGALVNADGMMTDDGTVYKLAANHLWVMTNADDFDAENAAHFAGLDVQLANRTHDMPLIAVQGPKSRETLQALTSTDLSQIRYFRFLPEQIEIAGIRSWIFRTGFSGELGFELIPARDDAVALWQALSEVGGVPVGLDAIEIARIEAGLIIIDGDYVAGKISPFDLSFDGVISLDPTLEIVGGENLSKAAQAPAVRFKTLRIDGSEVPQYGASVFKDGVEVGVVTSPCASPTFGTIGLARLATEHSANGTSLDVELGEGGERRARAFVSDLSIHDPQKLKPRS